MNTFANTVQLVGNLGNDPYIVNFEGGKKVARFKLATNESYKSAEGDKQTVTNWHTVFAWGKTASIIEKYAKKGKKLALQGMLINRPYETPDGEKRYSIEVRANQITLL